MDKSFTKGKAHDVRVTQAQLQTNPHTQSWQDDGHLLDGL